VRVTVRVPATSANLGPGFDCFGLALDLCNEITLDTDAPPGVTWEGEGAGELAADGSDLVSRAMVAAASARGVPAPTGSLRGVNRIPLERGLGSSAAAAVAGAALATAISDGPAALDPAALAAGAAILEGHLDNAAAASFGGRTVVADGRVHRFDVATSIAPVVLVPESIRLATADARRVLPTEIAREDAVFNVGHGALVVQALRTGDLELLRAGLRDRLHQDARLALSPAVGDVFRAIAEASPVCVSGSGPSLLAFEPAGSGEVLDPGDGWRVLRVAVRASGAEFVAP
jgi:homoserine kinase